MLTLTKFSITWRKTARTDHIEDKLANQCKRKHLHSDNKFKDAQKQVPVKAHSVWRNKGDTYRASLAPEWAKEYP